jgi:dihydrofolate reductase
MIAAVDGNWGIGFNNKLLYSCKKDLERFYKTIEGKYVIVGRHTYNSMPVLTNSKTIVMSKTLPSAIRNRDELFDFLDKHSLWDDAVVIGGSQIYTQLMPWIQEAYITKFRTRFEHVDAFIEPIPSSWTYKLEEEFIEKGIVVQFIKYTRP